jgi:hypothetical protein
MYDYMQDDRKDKIEGVCRTHRRKEKFVLYGFINFPKSRGHIKILGARKMA